MEREKSLVIDTDAFKNCCENENCWNKSFTEFFNDNILGGQLSLAIDEVGIIIKEYCDFCTLYSGKTVAKLLLNLIRANRFIPTSDTKKIYKYSPIPVSEIKELEKSGFCQGKLIFARITPVSGLKTVISTDTDTFLNENHKQWLESNLKITIYCPLECACIPC